VAAITTGVKDNGECVGHWYALRTDTPAARAFLADYVDLP
jgi:hypothetical protein